MTELKTITGNALYSQAYKEELMEQYAAFYNGLKDYKRDEYLEMLWMPDPKDVFKFDRKNPMHPLDFARKVQHVEIQKDEAELEHCRNLHKYDKKLTDKQMNYWEAYYKMRDIERRQVFDKSQALKDELTEQKNLLELYKEDEAQVEEGNSEGAAVQQCAGGSGSHQGPGDCSADHVPSDAGDSA